MKKLFLIALMLILSAGCSRENASGPSAHERFNEGIKVGSPARDFQYHDMTLNTFRLSEKQGKVVLVYFWRMKCDECKKEIVELQSLHEKYGPRGLVVVAVGADTMHSAPIIKVKDFLAESKVTFTAIRDDEGFVSEAFGVMRAPEAYLIDRKGIVAHIQKGKGDWGGAEKAKLIESLL